ncbi:5-formyltetrahydrofolate cyclo-ligase [Actinotalea sp. AC32]|nr:5-formyltetrahydrofolate cyclo-ligase [Actinotalea sp. AC32]
MSKIVQPFPSAHGLGPAEAKNQLRRAIRAEREKRSPRALLHAAQNLAQVVGDMPQLRNVDVVACYVSRPTEPGTVPLVERLTQRGVRVLLPVLGAGLQRDWAWYTSTEDLQVRAPGRPPEPSGPTLGGEAIAQAQAVVVPALAVDTRGARLGQGGGWYDRVLAHAEPEAPLVAMVFAEELYDADERPLPQEPHDVTVPLVATPAGWQRLRTTAGA